MGGSLADVAVRASSDGRARELIVVRESDESDRLLFDAMRQQTYAPLLESRPEVAAIAAMGMFPMESATGDMLVTVSRPDGSVYEEHVLIESIRYGKTKAILFELGGTYHLWSMASAATLNYDNNKNGITEVMARVIRRLRPRTLRAANISRLIRSTRQADILALALRDNVDRVVVDMPFDLTEEEGPGWQMLRNAGMMAAIERKWIATRTQAGRIAQWRRGEWPMGAFTVPFGFRCDAATKRLVPDEAQRVAVRQMLVVLGSNLTPQEKVTALSEAGVVSLRPDRRSRERRDVGELRNPTAILRQQYRYMPLWIHGEHLLRMKNLAVGATQVMSVPVMYREGEESSLTNPGEMQMLYRAPLPEGGWAEPSVLEAAREAALRFQQDSDARRRVNGSDVHGVVLSEAVRAASADPDLLRAVSRVKESDPVVRDDGEDPADVPAPRRPGAQEGLFGTRAWTDGAVRYRLESRAPGEYFLLRAPTAAARDRSTRNVREWSDQRNEARFSKSEVHRRFVEALSESLRQGVPVVHIRSHLVDRAPAVAEALADRQARTLREREARLVRTVKRAQDAYYEEPDDELASRHRRAEREAQRELVDVREQLDALSSSSAPGPVDEFEADSDLLMRALANIGSAGRFEREQVDAFRSAVPDVRVSRGQGPVDDALRLTL